MRALIIENTFSKERPNTFSKNVKEYARGMIVELSEPVFSEEAGSDSQWYNLEDSSEAANEYLPEDCVRIHITCSSLPVPDQTQYLIAYHQVNADGTIKVDRKNAPDQLCFAPVKLPHTESELKVNHWTKEMLSNTIVNSLNGLKDTQRHVFIYIPGYQLQILNQTRLDLLAGFTLSYLAHPDNSIAKVLFLSWPAQSGPKR